MQLQPMIDPILLSSGYKGNLIFFLKSLYFSPRQVFGSFLHVVFMNEK